MASPVDDPKSYLTFAQAAWGILIFAFGLGAGYANLKRDLARSKERHDGHDKKLTEIEAELKELAKIADLDKMKGDIIREVYALHGVDYDSLPRVVDRRRNPR